MKIGFIGAGKAGCSLGKYLQTKQTCGLAVTGYYSLFDEEARWAADFTSSSVFSSVDEVIFESDSVILSTPDGAIKDVWESVNKEQINGKCICHLSGSLSSDVFSGIEDYGAYPVSIHPLFAFSSRDSVYEQLNEVCFTLEGHEKAVALWQEVFARTGNPTVVISPKVKPKYHAAASMLSNHVVGVLSAGYEMLIACGFSDEEARRYTAALVRDNVKHVIEYGAKDALTGPIERNDIMTVCKHREVLSKQERQIYGVCGRKLSELAKKKHPDRDYDRIIDLLDEMIGG